MKNLVNCITQPVQRGVTNLASFVERNYKNLAFLGAFTAFSVFGFRATQAYAQSEWDILAGIIDLNKNNSKLTYKQRDALRAIENFARTQGERDFQKEITREGTKQTLTINYETGKQAQLVRDEQGNHYLLVDGMIYRYQPEQSLNDRARTSIKTAEGEIKKIWTDYNVYEKGEIGIRIHAEVKIDHNLGQKNNLVAYFYDEKGHPLRDKDGKYSNGAGQVAVGSDYFIPSYEGSRFKDIQLFIPCSQFDIETTGGEYINLKYELYLVDMSGSTPRVLATKKDGLRYKK